MLLYDIYLDTCVRRFLSCAGCGRGGTGRRSALRSLWGRLRGSSILLDRTIVFYVNILLKGYFFSRNVLWIL